jgi:hypothetical protein
MTLTNMNDMTLLFEQMETVRAAVPNFRDLGGYAAGSDGATRAGCLTGRASCRVAACRNGTRCEHSACKR